MRAYGDITVWGALGDHSRAGMGWFQQLRDRWVAHKAARRQAKLATLSGYWDARREGFRPMQAQAAPEMAAAQATLAVALLLYGSSR